MKPNLKRTASRESYANKKIQKLEDAANQKCCTENAERIEQLEAVIKEKERAINELTESEQYLNGISSDNTAAEDIVVFDEYSKKYLPNIKECVYELLTLNVSASKVCKFDKIIRHSVKESSYLTTNLPSTIHPQFNLYMICRSNTLESPSSVMSNA